MNTGNEAYFDTNSAFKFSSYNSKAEINSAIQKFLYDVKLRKREFLNMCVKYDPEFTSCISKTSFEIVLNNFTIYPTPREKSLIVDNFLVNDSHVNYITLCNSHYTENAIHLDPCLQHLNAIKKQLQSGTNYNINAKMLSKVIDVKPIELLNYQISEENFLLKIAKKVMEFMITATTKKNTNDFLKELFEKSDFDMDDKFSIGEMNKFLLDCGINLNDYDMRFFFESFNLHEGKIDKMSLQSYLKEKYQKGYESLARTDFVKDPKEIFTKEEMETEKKMKEIIEKNYLISVIKETLLVFGKNFMLKYFAQYLEEEESVFYIDNFWLEVGYRKLGYKEVSLQDMGAFKFLAINKSLAKLKSDLKVTISIEALFDFIITQFDMKNTLLFMGTDVIVTQICHKIFADLNTNLLSSVSKKPETADTMFKSTVDEFEFRRRFIQSFGILDHTFFDSIVKMMKQNEPEVTSKSSQMFMNNNNNNNTSATEDKNFNVFKLDQINIKQWLNLAYNFLFMGMIRYSDQLGLLLEDKQVVELKNIYATIEKKLFEKKRVTQKYKKIRNPFSDKTDENQIEFPIEKEPGLDEFIKKQIQSKLYEKSLQQKYTLPQENSILLMEFKTENMAVAVNEVSGPVSRCNSIPSMSNRKSEETKKEFNVNDTATIVPQLYRICADYLKRQFKLDKIDYNIISNLGICKIFRDELAKANVNAKAEMHYLRFINYIRHILPDDLTNFMEYYAGKYKNSNNQLNPQYLFSKIEEIMLQYSKISKDE